MTTPTAQPATERLLDLAEATRPDIDRTELQAAIAEAWQTPNWHWPRILIAVALILAHGEEPRDLRAALRGPYKGGGP
ncbi:hypothetical protein ACQEU3_47050 [Spirillospora sp. CA-253888]